MLKHSNGRRTRELERCSDRFIETRQRLRLFRSLLCSKRSLTKVSRCIGPRVQQMNLQEADMIVLSFLRVRGWSCAQSPNKKMRSTTAKLFILFGGSRISKFTIQSANGTACCSLIILLVKAKLVHFVVFLGATFGQL